MTATCSWY